MSTQAERQLLMQGDLPPGDSVPVQEARDQVAVALAEKGPDDQPRAIREAGGALYAAKALKDPPLIRTPPNLSREAEVRERLKLQDEHDERRLADLEARRQAIADHQRELQESSKHVAAAMMQNELIMPEPPMRSEEPFTDADLVHVDIADAHEHAARSVIEEERQEALERSAPEDRPLVSGPYDARMVHAMARRRMELMRAGIHPDDIPVRMEATRAQLESQGIVIPPPSRPRDDDASEDE